MSKRPHYEGDPTLLRVMMRPRWILALILSLAVGAGFAGLAQWQMGTAVKLTETTLDSETSYEIHELTKTGQPVNEDMGGRMVTDEMRLVPGDSYIVGSRMNQNEKGYWVVSHFENEAADEHLTVAVGWAESEAEAQEALEALDTDPAFTTVHEVEGRYMPSEGAVLPSPGEPLDVYEALATGQSINLWEPWQGTAFAGYLVSENAPDGLDKIDSFPPLPEEKINWLNLFYAIEWIVFAGFAIFFWYRLTRDAWEKEHELMQLQAESSGEARVE
ncbi:SURF1 family protein [Leucobacter chinensis]|uniref:SURF1 family protein n=1 Tax=Leucobacter chinensis TaxID=2851010 RepID=UPI001C223B8E|nr:SURF1 family protein [Leucobacter chinensis]